MVLAWVSIFQTMQLDHKSFASVTKYYIFVSTITLLLLTICLNLGNANISWNTTFTTIVIFGKISTGLIDLSCCFQFLSGHCYLSHHIIVNYTHTCLPLIWDGLCIPQHFLSVLSLVCNTVMTKLVHYSSGFNFHLKPQTIPCLCKVFDLTEVIL